jgi:hypothetical protein
MKRDYNTDLAEDSATEFLKAQQMMESTFDPRFVQQLNLFAFLSNPRWLTPKYLLLSLYKCTRSGPGTLQSLLVTTILALFELTWGGH